MKTGLGRLVLAIALLVAGAACWTEAQLSRRLADARQRFTTLQFDREDGVDEASTWLSRLSRSDSLNDEVRQLRSAMSYWRAQNEPAAPGAADATTGSEPGATARDAGADTDADELFATANTAFREVQKLTGDRVAAVERIDRVVQAYASVLRADSTNVDASFNYEYAARYRDRVAQGRGPLELSDLPAGLSIHGRPGGSPSEISAAAVPAGRGREAPAPEREPEPVAESAPEAESEPEVEPEREVGGEPDAGRESEAESALSRRRVFFVSPKDGETFLPYEIGSFEYPIVFEFGIENYEIAAVPDAVAQPRAGVGHYHFGVNTACLPPGEVIPQRDPWVGLDNGEARFERITDLPGEYTFTLQLGDDEHRAQAGMCETIMITVLE